MAWVSRLRADQPRSARVRRGLGDAVPLEEALSVLLLVLGLAPVLPALLVSAPVPLVPLAVLLPIELVLDAVPVLSLGVVALVVPDVELP